MTSWIIPPCKWAATGLTADVLNFSFSGKGVGTDQVFNVDAIIASAFNDKISGGFNAERFQIGAGNDTVSGIFGNDTLLGQGGDDRLTGGSGHDLMIGGTGRDTFVFDAALTAANLDHVADFTGFDDTIQLVRTGAGPFDALAFGALDPSAFHLGTVATRAGQHVL